MVSAYTVNDTTTLHNDKLSNYDKRQRPQSQTNLMLEFGLMHITELDWHDEQLQWNASDYGNMTDSMFMLSQIWIPPLVLSNAADEFKIIGDNSDFASSPVSSWMFLEHMIDLGSSTSTVNLDIYKEHGEWDIIGTSLSGYKLPAVEFTLELKRKYSYYLLNMLLPVIILATMAPFVFILPVESGEKIGFALTILLSLSVVMTIVSDNIPPTSTHICVLSMILSKF
ncbi:neuronal acetylcholine receptor subunit alpha-7-like [Ruditapes philippinarum]|uniref:neuronal acetylcholine receptor subunit alpha-7-like n=1 Tax=Ruditapes philippinarum TaxID=129788 RepID=UPI00295BF7F5|nr:neuronal acetylcholine receptor subunit alpha-7-like [Ruditapes philippinarum]